ncbi:MAG: hypothetical protein COV59_03425 [Candidatus Magasanikbacteria bacterium CG11_big_fil_rev_8_21_14_0_20_39_34]|uniref:DUF805 domain-containing protein n=1 Tax=Candidatus Magasanikbacteria bacterium CG11_big_fil_rev_8_21_14_0_20_39_34 TaxID=1974653 RepID=A0A2H0N5Q5_9BACT|nr:MAG: hypothetical protein COV59_03425 [Candidatus Magasanikbacteria bacterium CG11_big_fil_rev_8_21_14_0_20_39_34]
MELYLQPFKKYAVFEGRASRAEYWGFILIIFILAIIILLPISLMTGAAYETVVNIFAVFLFLPSLAVTVRRLHDINKSGWYVLLNLIPFIGGLILFIFAVKSGDQGDNKYGPSPKQMTST